MATQVQVDIRLTTGASAAEVARVTQATTALSRALHDVPSAGGGALSSIKNIAAGTFLGQAAFKALSEAAQLAGAGIRAIVDVTRQAIDASAEQERSTAALNAALRSTGQYTAEYSTALQDLAGSLQRSTTYGDDAILNVERILVQFGATREEVQKLTPAILDLATSTGQDLGQAAFKTAKALEGQTSALQKSGIALDENSKRGTRAAEIADKIAAKYGGQAAAAANTFAGAMAKLTNAWDDLLETMGNAITQNPAVIIALNALTDTMFDAQDQATTLADALDSRITAAIEALLSVLPDVVTTGVAFVETVVGMARAVVEFGVSLATNAEEVRNWALGIGLVVAAVGILNPAVAGLAVPLAAIAAGTAYTAHGISEIGQSIQDNKPHLEGLAEDLREGAESTLARIAANREMNSSIREMLSALAARKAALEKGGKVDAGALAATEEYKQAAAAVSDLAARGGHLDSANLRVASSLNVAAGAADAAGRAHAGLSGELDKGAKKRAELLAQVDKDLSLTRAEIEARKAAAAAGLDEVATLAQVEGAKLRAQGIDEKRVQQIIALKEEQGRLTEELKKFTEAQSKISDLQEQNDVLDKKLAVYQELSASGATLTEIERALATAEAAALGQTPAQIEALKKEAAANYDKAKALAQVAAAQQELDTLQKDNSALEKQLAILEQQRDGYLDAAAAARELAYVEAERRKGSALSDAEKQVIANNVRLREEVAKTEKQVSDSYINIGQIASQNLSKVIEGIALGTNKGLSLFGALKQGAKATWASMLQGMIESKLSFDGKISKNFLQDLPGVFSTSANYLVTAFSGAFNIVKGLAGGLVGTIQGVFNLLSSATSAAGAAQGAAAGGVQTGVAGQGASLLQQGQQLLSYGQTLYRGFQMLTGAVNAGTEATLALSTATTDAAAAYQAGTAVGYTGEAGFTGMVAPGAAEFPATTTPGVTAQGGSAASGLGGAAASAAILFAVVAALESLSAGLGAIKQRKTFYNNEDVVKAIGDGFSPWVKALGNLVAYVGTGHSGADLQKSTLETLQGQGSAHDYIKTIMYAILNPMLFNLSFWLKDLPTKGTVLRKHFEEYIENKELGAGFFARDSGTFVRGIGQTGKVGDRADRVAPDRLRSVGGGTRGVMEETGLEFVPAMREFIDRQRESIGLTEKQTDQFIALGVAFRAFAGKEAGKEEQRSLAIVADLLGSINIEGSSAAEAMQIVRTAIQGLGSPSTIFNRLTTFFQSEDNDIAVQDFRRAVGGLADAMFTDLPKGVDAATVAFDILDKKGTIVFSDLEKQMAAAVAEAEAFAPALQEAFVSGLFDQEIDTAKFSANVFDAVEQALKDSVAQVAFDDLIQGAFKGDILGPFLDTIQSTREQVLAGAITQDEANAIRVQALKDAREAMTSLQPLIDELVAGGRALADVFNDADDSAIGLATSLVRLQAAQQSWNDTLDARIFALRNEGAASPEVIRRPLPDIEREFRLLMLTVSGSISDVVAAVNAGVISKSEMPDYLARVRGGPKELSDEEKLANLTQMQALAERDLEIRIAAIKAETALAVKGHQDRIDSLQKERAAEQRRADAAIKARQKELDLIEKQIEAAEGWAQALETINQTILSLQTGSASPDTPLQRFGTAQREFDRLSAVVGDSSASAKDRQEAAAKLAEIGPQLLELAQSGGMAQSSEAYQALYDRVLKTLADAQKVAGEGAKDLKELQARSVELQEQIASIQEQSQARLDAIDASIQSEQDAITALQDAANVKIEQVSLNTAGVLEWIQGQGNAIFEKKQEELKQKLADLGVTSVDLNSIQAASLGELQKIRAALEAAGIAVNSGSGGSTSGGGGGSGDQPSSGRFGLTQTGQDRLRSTIGDLTPQGDTFARLQSLIGVSARQLTEIDAEGGPMAELVATIRSLFPGARSADAISTIAGEMARKIYDHDYVSPVLGFATGGLVSRPTRAVVGEGNRPELIVPLDRAINDRRFRQAFGDATGMRDALRALDRRFGGSLRGAVGELNARLRREVAAGSRSTLGALSGELRRASAQRGAVPADLTRTLARLATTPGLTSGGARLDPALTRGLAQVATSVGRTGEAIRASRPVPAPSEDRAAAPASDEPQREREVAINLNVAISVDGKGSADLAATEASLQPVFDRLLRRALAQSGVQARIAATTRRRNADAPRNV